MTERRKIHLSYSAISLFKKCPMAFFAKYIEGLRRAGQTDPQRTGINWHGLQEIVGLAPEAVCRFCANQMYPEGDCPVCGGTGHLVGDSIDAAFRMLQKAYEGDVPAGKTLEEILTERAKLFYSLSAYKWYWNIGESEPEYEVIATEVPFELDVVNPETGNACRDAILIGKIDKIVKFANGTYGQIEHKSTTKPVDNGSMFWNHLQMDTQTMLYPYAMMRLQKQGELEHLGIMPDDEISTTVLYDVWHKPQTKMVKLSQADTRKFVETGVYHDTEFEVTGAEIVVDGRKKTFVHDNNVKVDGHPATVEAGKAGDSIRETEGMYGTRLFTDLTSNPDKYFNRREIQRKVDDMARFENQLYSIYQAILMMRRTGGWWTDEHQCEGSHGRCDMTPYCWHGEEIKADNILEGFENMFNKEVGNDT